MKKTIKIKKGLIGAPINFFIFLLFLGVPIILFSLQLIMAGSIVTGVYYLLNIFFLNKAWSYKRSDFQTKIAWTVVLLMPATWFMYLRGGFVSPRKWQKIKESFLLENGLKDKKPELSNLIIYDDTKEKFDMLISDLKTAKFFIHIQYFIINDGILWQKIKQILLEKKKQGVDIKILIDYVGNVQTCDSSYQDLINNEIPIIQFNKVRFWRITGIANFRSHNKFVIIDNKIGYMGGTNIGDDYVSLYPKYGYWADMHVRGEGEIVYDFNSQFITQWFIETGELIPQQKRIASSNKMNIDINSDGPQYDEPVYLKKIIELIDNASKKVRIVTPYFIVPNVLMHSMRKAAKRGVDIQVITAGRADKKTAYSMSFYFAEIATNHNIKIYRMNNIFIHSKYVLVDDEVIVGTSNIDYRAFYLHYENNITIKEEKIVTQLLEAFENYKTNATLTIKSSSSWGTYKRFKYIVVRLVSVMF